MILGGFRRSWGRFSHLLGRMAGRVRRFWLNVRVTWACSARFGGCWPVSGHTKSPAGAGGVSMRGLLAGVGECGLFGGVGGALFAHGGQPSGTRSGSTRAAPGGCALPGLGGVA